MTRSVTSPRLIGRKAEMAALRAAVDRAARGEAVAVLVGGDAGVGKTRLVQQLVAEVQPGALVLVGHCMEVGEGELPYAPVAGALRRLAAELPPAELDQVLGFARSELARLAPDLAAGAPPPPVPVSGLGQARLFELLLGALGRLGRTRPVVLVIEDLHWADRSTRDLLRFLARNAAAERLALLVTYRTDEAHRPHPLRPLLAELEREPRVRRVEVAPFSRSDFADYVTAVLGELPDAAALDELYERSEGNAFFTEELLAAGAGPLPASLRDALLVRLERVSEQAQLVVRAAAVAGRRVDQRLLAAVAGLGDAELAAALREAVAAQVLVPVAHERAYEFRHALLREAVYADVLPGEREALHVALADELEARPELAGAATTAAAELAHHRYAAHELDLALPASIRAGEEAERVYAFAEALRYFERALQAWERVTPGARAGLDRVAIVERAAVAANMAGDHLRAVELARRGLDELDAAAAPVRAALLHTRLARFLWEAGRGDQAWPVSARAVELMPEEPTVERALVLEAHARLALLAGRVGEATGPIDEAIALAGRTGARDVEVAARATRVIALHVRPDEAIAEGRQALRLALELGEPSQILRAYANTCEALDHAGHAEEATQLAEEGLEVARRHGVERVWGAYLEGDNTLRLLKLGRLDEAAARIDRALRRSPTGIGAASLHQARAALAARRGDAAATQAALRNAEPHARQSGAGRWNSPGAVAATELALWRGDGAAARHTVRDALARLDEAEYVFYSAALYALGAWAEVDRALRARALRRDDEEDEATRAAAALRARLDERLASAAPPEAVAWRTQLAAELSRLEAGIAVDAWETARRRWEALGFPFQVAYCAWREAEARIAAGGQRNSAGPLLGTAYRTALALGARPLADEVEALARRVRIQLAEEPAPAPTVPAAAAATGITPRELEILGLLAEGRTNRQIGTALFISEKTVSIHVSRILAKLGAANRGEAAAIARRLGLPPDVGGAGGHDREVGPRG